MSDQKQNDLTQEVESWWNTYPFTFGISKDSNDLVGRIPVEKMNRAYFDEVERKFRKFAWSAQEDEAPLLSNLINFDWLKGKKVLDIAVGTGFSLVVFAENGAEVTGIDLTDFAVEQTKRNLAERKLSGTVLKMDAQAMTFPDETFDFVNGWGCYMHMPDTQSAINEAYRVLRPGGRTLAYMYNRDSWPFWFNTILVKGVLMGKLITYRGDITKLTSRYADGSSIGGNPLSKFYSKAQTKKMFEKAGFVNVRSVPFVLPEEPSNWPQRHLAIFKYLPSGPKRFLSKFGYGQIIKGEKT